MAEKTFFPIKDWFQDDKPREKLMLKGKNTLSDAELIAILIGSGSKNESAVDLSKRILKTVENNLNALGKLNLSQLTSFKGIGNAKAISILAALELGRRRRMEDANEYKKIISSKTVFEIMQPIIGDLNHEEFWIIYLNNSNKVLSKNQISKGGLTSTIVDPRIVFKIALEINATAILLCHNHPSGSLKPSEEDLKVTQKLKLAGENLHIKVFDHLIITETAYFSFADQEIL